MLNIHSRELRAPIEAVRPWIEQAWSGGERDIFPRDIVRSWRKNPPGTSKDALLPGVTMIGHGPFRFRFQGWDGARWRVSVERRGYRGWHGFDLKPISTGCRIAHTLEAELSGSARLVWPLFIAPLHDWIVEAMFDRLEAALASGSIPKKTTRLPSTSQAARLSLLRIFVRRPAVAAGN